MRALQEARRAGCDLAFLVADADDWPKDLYRRLGFDDLGRYVKFLSTIVVGPVSFAPAARALCLVALIGGGA